MYHLVVILDAGETQYARALRSYRPMSGRSLRLHKGRNTSHDFFFNIVLRPFQDYFNTYETGQSVGGRKQENPQEKRPGTPASRTWLVSHVASAGLELTPVTAVK